MQCFKQWVRHSASTRHGMGSEGIIRVAHIDQAFMSFSCAADEWFKCNGAT